MDDAEGRAGELGAEVVAWSGWCNGIRMIYGGDRMFVWWPFQAVALGAVKATANAPKPRPAITNVEPLTQECLDLLTAEHKARLALDGG